jgi:Zn-dependent protease
MLGDPTAEGQGRLTLNPLAHIDPVGTLLLPLLGVPIGWAKPVPINPALFHQGVSMRMGILLTAIAGPISNVCIAALCAAGYTGLMGMDATGLAHPAVSKLLTMLISMNIALAVFNMLPIPPLDGSRVVDGLLSDRLRPAWDAFARVGPIALLIVIVALAALARWALN